MYVPYAATGICDVWNIYDKHSRVNLSTDYPDKFSAIYIKINELLQMKVFCLLNTNILF